MSGRCAAKLVLTALVLAGCGGTGSRPAADKTGARFPNGTFKTTITRADLSRAGLDSYPNYPHVETLTLREGRWRGLYLPRRSYQPPAGGRYVVRGDEVTFILEYPPEGKGGRDLVSWSYFRGGLTFRIIDVPDRGARLGYTAHTWRKIR